MRITKAVLEARNEAQGRTIKELTRALEDKKAIIKILESRPEAVMVMALERICMAMTDTLKLAENKEIREARNDKRTNLSNPLA